MRFPRFDTFPETVPSGAVFIYQGAMYFGGTNGNAIELSGIIPDLAELPTAWPSGRLFTFDGLLYFGNSEDEPVEVGKPAEPELVSLDNIVFTDDSEGVLPISLGNSQLITNGKTVTGFVSIIGQFDEPGATNGTLSIPSAPPPKNSDQKGYTFVEGVGVDFSLLNFEGAESLAISGFMTSNINNGNSMTFVINYIVA
jgi:hypothetical protein